MFTSIVVMEKVALSSVPDTITSAPSISSLPTFKLCDEALSVTSLSCSSIFCAPTKNVVEWIPPAYPWYKTSLTPISLLSLKTYVSPTCNLLVASPFTVNLASSSST